MKTENLKSEIQSQNLEGMIQKALKHHQTGNFYTATILYKRVLKIHPNNVNAIYLLGTMNLQQGNFDTACIFFKRVLELIPDHATAHGSLGIALHKSGRIYEAIRYYRKAITLKPDCVDTYYNLGNAFKDQNNPEDAVICYMKAIELNPDDAGLYTNLGNTYREDGRLDKAVECYRRASELDPDNTGFHCNLGAALQESGKVDDAITCYKHAINLDPNYAMVHNNMGSAFQERDKPEEAETRYRKAIKLKPDYAEAYNNLGTVLVETGKYDEAEACHRKSISLRPDYAEAYNNLGIPLLKLGRLEEAAAYHRKAISLRPDYAEAYNNLGVTLLELGKLEEAVACYTKAIFLRPDYAEAHNNLGMAYEKSCKPELAISNYKHAIEINPDYAIAHLNMAIALLLAENFQKGWQEYEWRLRLKGHKPKTLQKPVWNGLPLKGKTILVYTEQGIGDAIQFVRYLPMVKSQGGLVIFECHQGLYRLLRNCDGLDKIIEKTSNGDTPIQYDVHIPLLSLPGIFNINMDSVSPVIPYIKPDHVLVSQWHEKLVDDSNFKVGIVWAGNPDHKNDRNRSCCLKDFAPLASIRGVSFYSLQKGQASVEATSPPKGMKIINLESNLNDFADTAAAIVNMDLVISVDTSVAHLAGAIGKPVWTLLHSAPDWRWFLNRNDSPWYPSMRLFRLNRYDDWRGVFNQVKKALINHLGLWITDCSRKNITTDPEMLIVQEEITE